MTRLIALALIALPAIAHADNLYRDPNWPAMTADRRAASVGDILTVNIVQAAEATDSAQNSSSKSTNLSGSIDVAKIQEGGSLGFGGGYSGKGEVRRSQRFVTQMSVTVRDLLPNGDLLVEGEQWLRINGERTRVAVQGRVRTADISADNSVLSGRIADARIDYDGKGFVSRSAKPGIVSRLFRFLGLS